MALLKLMALQHSQANPIRDQPFLHLVDSTPGIKKYCKPPLKVWHKIRGVHFSFEQYDFTFYPYPADS